MLQQINDTILTPALQLLPARMDTPEARVMLLAIGLQESRFKHRRQIVGDGFGPARGFWQFERGGGVAGVLSHPASRDLAEAVCELRKINSAPRPVWTWLAEDDVLACVFARLLLWTDPKALPALGKGAEAWDCYLRNWRPGKRRRRTWNGFYGQALGVFA